MKRIAVIFIILLIGVFLIAQENPTRMQHMREQRVTEERQKPDVGRMQHEMGLGVLNRLNLSEQQREQVRTFQHTHQLEMIDLRAEITKLRLQIRQAMQDNDFRNAIRLNDQLYQKEGEMARKGIELREKIHQVLTPEQREQMKQMPRTHGEGGNCEDCDCRD
ncbi:MAG: Spy/CpxP family protein refolding chaperone [Candidatus Cloacimonetes bacterium]|nr:Spy/CpxP family protein refolding chaperone [Candidatus Cloacimonadota bacterium]